MIISASIELCFLSHPPPLLIEILSCIREVSTSPSLQLSLLFPLLIKACLHGFAKLYLQGLAPLLGP